MAVMVPLLEASGLSRASWNPGWARTDARTPTLYLQQRSTTCVEAKIQTLAYPQTYDPKARKRQKAWRRRLALVKPLVPIMLDFLNNINSLSWEEIQRSGGAQDKRRLQENKMNSEQGGC